MRLSAYKFVFLRGLIAVLALSASALAQTGQNPQKTRESGEKESVPVLQKHLPSWESKTESARYFTEKEQFRSFFTSRKIIESVEFFPTTEAVFAEYPEGSLLIVEYATPQASAAIDESVLAQRGKTGDSYIYRRIGNYNVFLFDPPDDAAGNVLIDQISYEKVVTWPYGNPKPFLQREREFITVASSLFLSTVVFILMGLVTAMVLGAAAGVIYFQANTRRRAMMSTFSDAGGLTRLNLDGFTPDLAPQKLLDE